MERTEEEFRRLLDSAGFTLDRVVPHSQADLDAIADELNERPR
ncbi:hypothetical protein [Nocardia heshunensis]